MRKNFRVLMDVEYTTGVLGTRRRIFAGTVVGPDFLKSSDTAHVLKAHQIEATSDPIGPAPRDWVRPVAIDDAAQTKLNLRPEKPVKKAVPAKSPPPPSLTMIP